MPTSGRQPGVAAAEAEADGEDRSDALRAEVSDSRADIGLNTVGSRLLDVLHVLEIVAALRDPGGATEVVECHGRDASLGEPQRQFLVEPVEAAHIREDHDAHVDGLLRGRRKGGECIPVGRLEHEILMRDCGAADHRDGRY